MKEADLLPVLADHFRSLGYRTFAEVRVARRRADLVAVSGEEILATELKLRAWPQAIRQAVAYQVWCSRAYVALPFPAALRAVRHRHRFEGEAVGLLAVLGREVRTLVAARPSPRTFPPLGGWVRERLAGGAEGPPTCEPTGERF